MNQSSVKALAEHLGLSLAQASRHCNAAEVPTYVLEGMQSFVTPLQTHIPKSYLPKGNNKKPGPKKGWLEARLKEARERSSAADVA